MKSTYIILIALLTAGSLSKITPKAAMQRHSLLQGDYLYKDLNEYFNLDEVSYPLTVTGTNAIANNQTQPYLEKHFQLYNFKKLDWVKPVSEDTLIFCYDYKNIVVQVMNGEGKYFGYHKHFLVTPADVVCHDVAHYEHRDYFYVGCISRKSTSTNPGAVFVATWNYSEEKVTHIEVTDQDDGFRILNRLGIVMTEKSSTNGTTPYLVVYDSGNTNAVEHRGNDQLRVYRNVDIGKLRHYKLLQIDDHEYSIVYTIFPYKQSLVLAGRVKGATSSIITLAHCSLNFKQSVVSCDAKLRGTTVTKGIAGLNTSGLYYEINSETKKITVANLKGNFHDNDWNRDIVYTQENLKLLEHESTFIRSYVGNSVVGVINYGTVAGEADFGYTGISFYSNISWAVEGFVASNIEHSIIFGKQEQSEEHEGDVIQIMRPVHPYLLVDASKLPLGQKTAVGVSVEDADSSGPISTSSSITVVKTIFDKVNVQKTAYGNDIKLKGAFENRLHLDEEDIIEGNALHVTAVSKDGAINGRSHSGVQLDIEWSPSHDHSDVLKYAFYQNKAVV